MKKTGFWNQEPQIWLRFLLQMTNDMTSDKNFYYSNEKQDLSS